MRKNFFLWVSGALFVLLLIIGFENIFTPVDFSVLFYTFSQLPLLMVVFLSAFVGFLICFFFMLYSHEKRLEKELQEAEDTMGSAPGAMVDKEEKTEKESPDKKEKKEEEKPIDDFDEDDETLG